MLVLSRRIGEGVEVRLGPQGATLRISIARTRGKQIWLAFEAERSAVQILRDELVAGRKEVTPKGVHRKTA